MIQAGWVAQAVYVAARLGIADRLAEGPRSSDVLAREIGADPGSLRRLLRGLTALDLCVERDDGAFELAPLGDYLRTGVPGSVRATALHWGGSLWPVWATLLHSVKTGRSLRGSVTRQGSFESLARSPAAARDFNESMVETSRLVADAVVGACDFSRVARLVDVGGGLGELLSAVLLAHPAMRGVLLDLPHVVEDARAHLEAAGVADRCEVVAGSFFESVPGGDACLLKAVLHDWDDDRAVEILRGCRRALSAGGRVLVIERLLPERMRASAEHRFTAASDLSMLVALGGRERTAAEYRALLEAAGFVPARTAPAAAYYHVIEGAC